jgi:hypothetical protein
MTAPATAPDPLPLHRGPGEAGDEPRGFLAELDRAAENPP